MKKTKMLKVLSSAMALSLVLAGCSTGTKSTETKPKVEFKKSVENGGNAVNNATLKVGILTQQPLTGMWNPVFYLDAADYYVIGEMIGQAFAQDDTYRLKQDVKDAGVMFNANRDTKEVTLTVNKNLKWSNGENVTADDILATYHLMGNPKYIDNVRYTESYELIEGMKEYHEGKADTISGLVKKDDNTVVMKYKEITPSLLWGDGFITSLLNKKQVEDASKDFSHFVEAELNTKPLSYGPYVIEKTVPGESARLVANEHYFKKDEVKTKVIEFTRVTPDQATQVMKSGGVDFMEDLTPSIWENSQDAKNGDILGNPALYMSYVGFKLGTYDQNKGEVVVNPDAKAADVRVRQAFGYAVDWDQINEKLYKGLRFTPTGSGMYPPIVELLFNKEATGFKKDDAKAKKLLDEAGFKDVDGDGLRENAKGEKVTFNFAIRNTGQDIDQPLADTFIKSWKDVGLDVKLVDGKLMESKDWSKRVQEDDPSIDIFQGAWGLGTNPNPTDLLGEKSPLNYQRYINDELSEDMKEFNKSEMFDDAKLAKAYHKFDNDFAKVSPWLPFSWKTDMVWVNKRIKNFNYSDYKLGKVLLSGLELTEESPKK